MKQSPTPKVVELLLRTLAGVQKMPDGRADDLAMRKLKQNVFRMVAELKAAKRCEPAAEWSRE